MQFSSWFRFAAVATLATAVTGADLVVTRGSQTVNYEDLKRQLSKSAEIYKPGSDQFDGVVARWSNASVPHASIVVVPNNEQDIVKTVSRACNSLIYSFVYALSM